MYIHIPYMNPWSMSYLPANARMRSTGSSFAQVPNKFAGRLIGIRGEVIRQAQFGAFHHQVGGFRKWGYPLVN